MMSTRLSLLLNRLAFQLRNQSHTWRTSLAPQSALCCLAVSVPTSSGTCLVPGASALSLAEDFLSMLPYLVSTGTEPSRRI